jgi:hypothetical protein
MEKCKISKKIVGWKIKEEMSKISDRTIPARPFVLNSETRKIKLDTGDGVKNAYITVSFYPNSKDPYEIFVVTPIGNNLKDLQIMDLSTRMASLALRHGVPLSHVIDQLNKIDGQYIYSIPTNLAKALQSYVKYDSEPPTDIEEKEPVVSEELSDEELDKMILSDRPSFGIAGAVCPKCKQNAYIMQGGCGNCLSCTYSGCS